MLTLFREGGVPMIVVLLFGLCALYAAARPLFPGAARPWPLRSFVRATVLAALSGVAADLAAVGHHVSAHYNEYRSELVETLLQGLAESCAPAILGLSLAALACFVDGFGRREERLPCTPS
jgi:hypothetical protein